MTADIRANVFCSLGGTVISGGISDEHAQNTGLIRTRGEITLRSSDPSTLVRPQLGQEIDIAYALMSDNGIDSTVVRLPRKLYAIGYTADPYKKQTTIQLGCRLAYLENNPNVPDKVNSWDDPENAEVPCDVFDDFTFSIEADYILRYCLQKLGIQTNFGGFGKVLTNVYTRAQFDLSAGYISIINDLLLSESKVGFMTAQGLFAVKSLSGDESGNHVIDTKKLIDAGPINTGPLAAATVIVNYSYNRFKNSPKLTEEEKERKEWTLERTEGPPETHVIAHEGGTYVRTITPVTVVITEYDTLDRVKKRTETTTTHVCATNPNYIRWYKSIFGYAGPNFYDGPDTIKRVTEFTYVRPAPVAGDDTPGGGLPAGQCDPFRNNPNEYNPETDSEILSEVTKTYVTEMSVAGALDLDYTSPVSYQNIAGLTRPAILYEYHPSAAFPTYVSEQAETSYEVNAAANLTKTITVRQQMRAFRPAGGQNAAGENELSELYLNDSYIADIILRASALVNLGTIVQIRQDKYFGLQRRPTLDERNTENNLKEQIQNFSTQEFITTDTGVGFTVSYTMPYASDDRLSYDPGTFGEDPSISVSQRSDAASKAATFGRTQNKLAAGHRCGISLQMVASECPTYPLDGFNIERGNGIAAYWANGISYSFDSNGIIASVDALLVGGLGTTPPLVSAGYTLPPPAPVVYEPEEV